MKAEDLMIGDWLLAKPDNKYVRVISVLEDDIVCNQRCYDLKPIPITSEILKKNGFVLLSKKKKIYFDMNIALRPMGFSGPYKIENTMMFVEYVHELQHALKLCKIDKEIKL